MNKRDFLKLSAGAAGAVVVAQASPAEAKAAPVVDATGDIFQRVNGHLERVVPQYDPYYGSSEPYVSPPYSEGDVWRDEETGCVYEMIDQQPILIGRI